MNEKNMVLVLGGIVVVAVIATVAFLLLRNTDEDTTPTTQQAPQQVSSQETTEQAPVDPAEQGLDSITGTRYVEMTDEGFSPNVLTVQKGFLVVFDNKSSVNRWPASDDHPTHQIVPDFDPLEPIVPGDNRAFQFNEIGSWGYHDHLDPRIIGTIIVTELEE